MEYFTLYNGVKIPKVGFGTYKVIDQSAQGIVETALCVGYRHLDTARMYTNEKEVGAGMAASGIARKDIFLTTKVWRDDLSYDATMASVENSLKDLGTDYLDLCLLHWPMPETDRDKWQEKDLSAWRALEKLYKEKVIRSIGVSNFLPHHLMPLMKEAEITPMVNQLEYHPGYCQSHAVHYSQQQGLLVEAWSPLGRTRVLEDPLVLEMAEKYGKTPAQVCLRFALDNQVLPLPKSGSVERMKANLDVFDFTISPEDMSRLMCMPQTGWGGHHPDTF